MNNRSLKMGPFLPLVILLLIAAGCRNRGSGDEKYVLGNDNTLTGEATLLCSQACLDRAQCGYAEEMETVLLNSAGPATTGHDMAVPAGTAVVVDHQEMFPVIQISDQSSSRAAFYFVNVPDAGMGWVAGWCIGYQAP